MALSLADLGEIHDDSGDRRAARQVWQEALSILDGLAHPDAEGIRARLAGTESSDGTLSGAGAAGPAPDRSAPLGGPPTGERGGRRSPRRVHAGATVGGLPSAGPHHRMMIEHHGGSNLHLKVMVNFGHLRFENSTVGASVPALSARSAMVVFSVSSWVV
ncbi:hypothetical protein JD77_05816 [Micromonospora olivasterospora]|uniref:Tetratricopeptide repeat protein n=1 Tax=Micromonospora olivasterospora TaxID=1880 RepID=A0A562IIF0_MICOL|nr:hypothetical protein JD77_05816 [Micromonospora olivasterospora]